MSNIGTSLKAMGRIDDAERWWRKAISLKPVYWDAIVGTKVLVALKIGLTAQ